MKSNWKKEYTQSWGLDNCETMDYINEKIQIIAVEYYGDNPFSEDEFQGFQIGALSYIIKLTNNGLPSLIKNIKVEAMKSFQKTQEKYESVVISQEFYKGYLEGFMEMFNRFYE